MSDLFSAAAEQHLRSQAPLAARLRPRTLDEVVGQDHLVGEGRPLRRLVEQDRLTSAIFWGPPGTGKTTLALAVAGTTRRAFEQMSAVTAGVKDVREVIERARQQIMLFRIILLIVSTVIVALIIFTMTMEKTRDIATLKIIGTPNLKIGSLIMQESLSLGLLGYLFGALLISLTYDYFPRRVAILAFDQYVLFGIVMVICVLASLVGIRRALAIDPTTAMGGGA